MSPGAPSHRNYRPGTLHKRRPLHLAGASCTDPPHCGVPRDCRSDSEVSLPQAAPRSVRVSISYSSQIPPYLETFSLLPARTGFAEAGIKQKKAGRPLTKDNAEPNAGVVVSHPAIDSALYFSGLPATYFFQQDLRFVGPRDSGTVTIPRPFPAGLTPRRPGVSRAFAQHLAMLKL